MRCVRDDCKRDDSRTDASLLLRLMTMTVLMTKDDYTMRSCVAH